jgi:hypothetical protein
VQRHELDPVALVVGAIFTIFGLAYAIGRWNWFDFGGAWVLALALIALGLAGVVTASGRRSQTRPTGPSANGSATDPGPV